MAVAANVICAWPSTAASIPTGWTRETALDGRYVQGAAAAADADLVTNRGQATHTHTSPSHTPVQDSHTHTVVDATASNSNNTFTGVGFNSATAAHTHGSSNSTAVTAINNPITMTVNANTSNDLPYKEVIFIKSDGTPDGIPVGAYAYFSSDSLPSGWSRVQGDTYLKGAAALGDGGATGGSATHTHTEPGHTHTQVAHQGEATSNASSGSGTHSQVAPVAGVSLDAHTHHLSFDPTTAVNQATTVTINSANHEPVFKKLNTISNGNASASLPDQIIALWGGTNAGIPTSWARFTSMDGNFVKGANANGESNVTTGGTTTHTHTTAGCQPIQNSHTHTYTDPGPGQVDQGRTGASSRADDTHLHTWTIGSTTATNQLATVTVDANTAETAYPPYRRLIFIVFTAPPAPGKPVSVYTSYSTGRFFDGGPEGQVTPEVAARVYQGDRRFMRQGDSAE